MLILKYLCRCFPVCMFHSILGSTFYFPEQQDCSVQKAAPFSSSFLTIPLHFNKLQKTLSIFLTVTKVHPPQVQARLRQQYLTWYRHGAHILVSGTSDHQAHYNSIPLGQHFTRPAGSVLLLSLFACISEQRCKQTPCRRAGVSFGLASGIAIEKE